MPISGLIGPVPDRPYILRHAGDPPGLSAKNAVRVVFPDSTVVAMFTTESAAMRAVGSLLDMGIASAPVRLVNAGEYAGLLGDLESIGVTHVTFDPRAGEFHAHAVRAVADEYRRAAAGG
jgi:hypothetical protein